MTASASVDPHPPSVSATLLAPPKKPQWPAHNAPRVWFLTDGLTPVATVLSRQLLEHGDYVVAGIVPEEFETSRGDGLRAFMKEVAVGEEGEMDALGAEEEADSDEEAEGEDGRLGKDADSRRIRRKRWSERFKLVGFDGRNMGQCQSAIADALAAFDHIDILLICRSEALVGSVEELNQSIRTRTLVRDQFETNFFAPVNIIRALLPSMREKRNGHIVAMTGITAHLGTPGLGIYCSSQWALEGYCDSLAYEIAPFNIKMTIVQPNLEIPVLTNKITSVPPLPEYTQEENPAPLSREILSGLLDRLDDRELPAARETTQTPQSPSIDLTSTASGDMFTPGENEEAAVPLTSGDMLHAQAVTSLFPTLPPSLVGPLVNETVFAIAAIGGHDNPPSRHIVGPEGVASVKEKLKTVSEELEDFLAVSGAVDIGSRDTISEVA